MENNNDNEREKLLLHSVVDTVKEHDEKISAVETVVENLHIDSPIPTKTSELDNDSGFVTASDLPSVPTRVSQLTNDSGFATQTDLQNLGEVVGQISDDVLGLQTSIPTKTSDLDNDSGFVTDSDLQTTINNLGENMINTTDLENGIDELNTTNSNGMNTLGTKIEALTVAVRGIGADFTQVDADENDVLAGKTFFDDAGILQQGTIPTFAGDTTITENGTVETGGKFVEEDLTVAVPRPQLEPPTVTLNGRFLSFQDISENGHFVECFKVFANDDLVYTATSNTSIDLADYVFTPGTYDIAVKSCNAKFEDSLPSTSFSFTVRENTPLFSVTQVSALMNDYVNEDDINTSASERLQIGAQFSNSATTRIWFRHNPIGLSCVQVALTLYFSDLQGGAATTIPYQILLNGETIVENQNLAVSAKTATCNFAITSGFQLFNELEIVFTNSAQAASYLTYIDIAITGTKNCIILNRDTDFEIDGLLKSDGETITEYARFYAPNENTKNKYISGDNLVFPSSETLRNFSFSGKGSVGFRYACSNCYRYYNSKNGKFEYNASYPNTIYIAQDNKLYPCYNYSGASNHTQIMENTSYAKMETYNGDLQIGNLVCITKYDFDVAIGSFDFYTKYYTPFPRGTSWSLKINNENLAKEFVDFVPVQDYYILSRTSNEYSCGYFLLHKSGYILFLPNMNASCVFKIGKGRQVNAFLSEDGLSINVYYNLDSKVYKRTLTRQSITSTNWTLLDQHTTFNNFKEIRERASSFVARTTSGVLTTTLQ